MFDTPGIVTPKEMKKYDISKEFVRSCRHSIQSADMIAVIQDVSNSYTRNMLHQSIVDTLQEFKKVPSILIMNKVDMIRSKRIVLDLIKVLTQGSLLCQDRRFLPWGNDDKFTKDMSRPVKYKNHESLGWPNFSEVFIVSAMSGDGVGQVKKYFQSKCATKKWEHKQGEFTDRTTEQLIVDNVRATLMHFLPNEVPYKLQVELEYLDESNGIRRTHSSLEKRSKYTFLLQEEYSQASTSSARRPASSGSSSANSTFA